MARIKISISIVLICFTSFVFAQADRKIPIGGNAFVVNSKGAKITEKGIENWTDANEVIKLYFRVSKPGTVSLSIDETAVVDGKSAMEFSINNDPKRIMLDERKKTEVIIGSWLVKDSGYVEVAIKGISKTKKYFPNIVRLNLGGSAIDAKTTYVKNNEGNYFYWGRRGPSVHLNYQMPEKVEAEWFYNEITVPKGNDIIGSYFMANGFAEGYFGIQVNSLTERRVLFSVWSPFNTDNPKEIPESHKIVMLKKGTAVHAGEFGNEGVGGQSYLKYNWKAETTYKFLLHAAPGTAAPKPNPVDGTVDLVNVPDSTTTYTAYFFSPELNQWQLIASFKRPKTQTYLTRLHSFLENFIPENGNETRKVVFSNQWICDTKGNWIELNKARFTIDNTGRINYRKDYLGGLLANGFYLQNCGFFNNFLPPNTTLTRVILNKKPTIAFDRLPLQ